MPPVVIIIADESTIYKQYCDPDEAAEQWPYPLSVIQSSVSNKNIESKTHL